MYSEKTKKIIRSERSTQGKCHETVVTVFAVAQNTLSSIIFPFGARWDDVDCSFVFTSPFSPPIMVAYLGRSNARWEAFTL